MELTPVKGLIVACSPIFQVGTGEPCRLLQLAADDEHYTVALVEHATKELAIGLGISIREYIVHDDGWVSCHQSGVSSSPMDEGFQVAETIWSRFPGPPFNYQGRCTGIIDAGLRYELDEHLQLLYEGQLSVGEQYLFYNLCARERALRRELLTTACPLYTTVDRHECSSLSHRQWSIHDSFLWRRQAGEMRTILEGLLSSSHLRSVEGYTELGLRICRAIRGGVVSDPVIEFRRHCREGQCHYCAEPVLPQNFLTKDEACQSEICVSLLGLLSVCQVTGRPLLRAGSVELNLLLTPELQARHPWQFDHLAVCIDATVYRDNDLSFAILTQPPIYVAPIVARDSQTGPSKREKEGVRGRAASSPPQDLVLIKSLSSTPILLSKTGGMRMSMEGYKFGKLCLHRGKLEMVGQTATNLSISAAAAVRRALAPGAVIVLAPHESPDECKVLQYEAGDENAMAKEIRLISMDKYLIRLSCSPVAAAYLQESRDLLTSRLNAPSGVPPLVALVMSKEYVTAALLGLPQPVRSKVPYHIWGEKYLVVNLQCAFTRQRLCLPPGYLHPLGLVVGAKLNIYHCKSLKDLQGGPLLIPTSHTVIMFAGMQQQQGQSTGAIDVSALEYPIKFIHELSDFDYSTINGRFLRLLTFEAHARCHSCHAVLRASSCLSHGIMDQSRCELEIQALFCFTDGLEEVKVVISDVSILDRAGLITRDRLMEMAMSSVISVDYRLGGGAPETASGPNILLGPLRSLPFLMQDYHLIALALPASGLARLQALAIKPIDYFDQCRRLLAINREALLASPEKAYKPVSG